MLTVSIVLFKTPLLQVERCLNSIALYKGQVKVYLVDNSPEDNLRHSFNLNSNLIYIHVPSNPGFGAGHNIAINYAKKMTQAQYHLVINADVYFEADVISPMIIYMNEQDNVGQMMPMVRNVDGSIQRLCKLVPTPFDLLFRRFLPYRYRCTFDKVFELHDFGYDKIMFVPYLSGCFMLFRHSYLAEIGLFDERFFMYPEDIDITRRMAVRYDTLFFPRVSVYHEHGAASRKSMRMFLIHGYNIIKYFNKWGWFRDAVRNELNNKAGKQFSY